MQKTLTLSGLLALAAACATEPAVIYSSIEASPELVRARPADIAVLPVEDATGDQSARDVCGPIREAITQALVDRLYTPLGTDRIDEVLRAEGGAGSAPAGSVVDAAWLRSLGGKFGEDATLGVRITAWDQSSLMSTGWVRFGAEVVLVGASDPAPLWSGSIRGEVKAGGASPAPMGRRNRELSTARVFAQNLIQRLPERRP